MKQPITQQRDYGCGIACFAFVADMTYKQAEKWLGKDQANSNRFYIKDFREALNRFGLYYSSKHIKTGGRLSVYRADTIVLIRRSKRYPAGHYLVRHGTYWMDPWINLSKYNDINLAQSGYRKRLPGRVMYAIYKLK